MALERNEILEQALKLPDSDRAAIAEELLSSLDGEEPDAEVELAWQKEVARRLSDLESGRARTVPWEKVYADLRASLSATRT
jgi:putative addiction module component (TIGR02574 family)